MEKQITSFLYSLRKLPQTWDAYKNDFRFEVLNKSNTEKFIQIYLEVHKDSASEVFLSNNTYQYARDAILDDDWLIPSLCKLAYQNDNIVGIILGGKEKDLAKFGKIGILEFIGVVPQYRCRGIGQKLFFCALVDLKNHGFNYCCDGTLDRNIPMLKLFNNLPRHLTLLAKGRNWEIDAYLEKNPLTTSTTRPNFSIRPIEGKDIPFMTIFLKQCALENSGKRTLVDIYKMDPDALQGQIDEINESKNDFLLIASLPDKIIGALDFYDVTNNDDSQPLAELGITILKDYQNQGIGTKLLLYAMDKARSDTDIKQIMLSVDSKNASAIHVYEKLGFEISNTCEKVSKTTLEMILKL